MPKFLPYYVTFALLLAGLTLSAQTGPGGIGSHKNTEKEDAPVLALWLRADDLNLNDGDNVTSWVDVSGNNHVATPGKPGVQGIVFQTDQVNGKPWVRFFGENYLKVPNHEVLDGGEGLGIFIIAKRDPLVADKYGCNTTSCFTSSNLITKRAHWNAWSHSTGIPMEQGPGGLDHAYELRWDQTRVTVEGGEIVLYPDTMELTAFANGNLPDGSGAVVFPSMEDTKDIDESYLISYCYSNHEDSYGSFVRVNGKESTRRPERGNPNPARTGDVVQSTKDLWIGAAEYDPPGAFGGTDERDECPTCNVTALLEGAIAEVIIYKGTLWHTQVFIIENYLSLKYDRPLVDSVKYYHDEVFIHDLAGIGNEFGDDKKQSLSESHALSIEELNESLDSPRNYLFAAHNGADYDYTQEGLTQSHLERWGREWKFEKHGDMDVRLSFNFLTAELNLVNAHAPRFRVAYRENLEDDYTLITEVQATRVLRTLHFIIPNEMLESGYYTLVSGYDPEVNIEENLLDNFTNSFSVFPSPAKESIRVSFASQNYGDVTINVLDITGRLVSTHNYTKNEDHFEARIDLGNLNNGLYLVEALIDGHKAVKRIIKN